MPDTDAKTAGEFLEAAVAAFESRFETIDDTHMHGAESRTTQGTRFVKVLPGTSDVTQPIAYQDHAACAKDWLNAAWATAVDDRKVLLWRVRPHFLALAAGGFTIESMFATEAEVTPEPAEGENKPARILRAVPKKADRAPVEAVGKDR